MTDLRSDTLTMPCKGMMEAIMSARVGDDVFEEDPATKELEEYAARLFGMEAALFCPSGTMTNQIAIKVHTNPGDEVICHKFSHVYNFEGGGIAVNSGVSSRLLEGARGRFTAQDVLRNINDPENVHLPVSKLVIIENTCNKGGGSYWDIGEIERIREVCLTSGLKLHLDGARIFNALTETGEKPESYGHLFDSISVCLSKGLGAPVGSLLIGDKKFIKQSRRTRKYLGGGMRQAGFIAAAGLYALKNNTGRLKKDHLKAKELAGFIEMKPFVKHMEPVDTNIIVFDLADEVNGKEFISYMEKNGVRLVSFGPQTLRMVTHLGITDEMIADVIKVLNRFPG